MRITSLIFILLVSCLVLIETKKSSKKSDNEDVSRSYSYEKKPDKHKWKPLESSEEIEILQYRKKEMKNKKTLGDVFQEKKKKKQAKKDRFAKNVLKYFKNDDEEESEESSEEIVAPLRRTKLNSYMECDSIEDCD